MLSLDKLFASWKLLKANLALSVLFTVVPSFFLGPFLPSKFTVAFCLLGTWLMACAAFVYNQILERDTDALMIRTQKRPLVGKTLSLPYAYILGSSLLGLGLCILLLGTNLLTASIAFFSFFYYVVIYTILLKPNTSWNTVLGGVAGSLGPLIGEATVNGKITEVGIAMFLLLFFWQPAHFWCLALNYLDDYKKANIPVLPVQKGVSHTLGQMIFYQFILSLSTLLFALPPISLFGIIFLLPSFSISIFILYGMWRLQKTWGKSRKIFFTPMRIFFLTIIHMLIWHITLGLDLYFRYWQNIP